MAVLGRVVAVVVSMLASAATLDTHIVAAEAPHPIALPAQLGPQALLAGATPEGDWQLTNRRGETLTVATPDEMTRAIAFLAIDGANAGAVPVRTGGAFAAGPAIVLPLGLALRERRRLGELPASHRLLVVDRDELHVLQRPEKPALLGASQQPIDGWAIDVAPGVRLAMGASAATFAAHRWLRDPLEGGNVQIVALLADAGTASPVATGDDGIARIEMGDLAGGMRRLADRPVAMTGQIDGEHLIARAGDGRVARIAMADVERAALASWRTVMIAVSGSGGQPGTQNNLRRQRRIDGLVTKADSVAGASGSARTGGAILAGMLGGDVEVTASTPTDGTANLARLTARRASRLGVGLALAGARESITGTIGIERVIVLLPGSKPPGWFGGFLAAVLRHADWTTALTAIVIALIAVFAAVSRRHRRREGEAA